MVIMLNQIFLITFSLLLLVGGVNLKGGYANDKFSKSIYEKYQVTIYRDTWGVPHIFGEKDEDTAYGLGYAHAEDDFETIQNILIAARGSLAQYHGRSAAANDYMVKMLKIWNIVEKNYESLSDDVIKISEAYADGINHYANLYPEKVYKGILPVKGKDIVAGFIHRMPLMLSLIHI